jgi:hypothetical protein|tara:strand:+ start:105 stop:500 length:396 start_codon:yes stop_codon:yes gene_type:complete
MKQRVNIQYSIDISDLNIEVKRLTDIVEHKLNDIRSSFPSEDRILDLETLSKIEKVRTELANVDFMLSDIDKIVNAYISYRTNSDSAAGTQPSEMAHQPTNSQEVDISEKIENLKQLHESMKNTNDRVSRT